MSNRKINHSIFYLKSFLKLWPFLILYERYITWVLCKPFYKNILIKLVSVLAVFDSLLLQKFPGVRKSDIPFPMRSVQLFEFIELNINCRKLKNKIEILQMKPWFMLKPFLRIHFSFHVIMRWLDGSIISFQFRNDYFPNIPLRLYELSRFLNCLYRLKPSTTAGVVKLNYRILSLGLFYENSFPLLHTLNRSNMIERVSLIFTFETHRKFGNQS